MEIYCPQCGLAQAYREPGAGNILSCNRCEYTLINVRRNHNLPALLLTVSALILYIPANTYPILAMTYVGRRTESTIIDGVISLAKDGMFGLALLIFAVSFLIPLFKILVMLYLLLLANRASIFTRKLNNKLLRFVDYIGPWSMLDVFLVAILVALVKLQDIVRAEPGPAIVPFAGVVVLTLLASKVFDPRLLWEDKQ